MTSLILVAHNVRSALNVGALLRSAACFDVAEFVASGYTPYPRLDVDTRLPHIAERAHRQIAKTALGAENLVTCQHVTQLADFMISQRQAGYHIIALEQAPSSVSLAQVRLDQPIVLIVGNEVEGLDEKTLDLADTIAEIPMPGRKESLNVSVAAGIAMYQLRQP